MPAPLEDFLHLYQHGGGQISPEWYDKFDMPAILAAIQKFDPNAKWTDVDLGGGGEGGAGSFMGKKLDFDITKAPKVGTTELLDLRPGNWNKINPNAVFDDPTYGNITHSKNIKHDNSGLHAWAPLIAAAIAMGGPMAGAALASAGIGGAAGLTSAVTGGAAGLGAGSIPGAMGAGTFAGTTPSWITNAVKGGPQTLGRVARGDMSALINPILGIGGSMLGINPYLMKGGMTLANLARRP